MTNTVVKFVPARRSAHQRREDEEFINRAEQLVLSVATDERGEALEVLRKIERLTYKHRCVLKQREADEAAASNGVALPAFAKRALQFRQRLTQSQIGFLELLASVSGPDDKFFHNYHSRFLMPVKSNPLEFKWHDCFAYNDGPSDKSLAQRFLKVWLRVRDEMGEPQSAFERDLAAYAEQWDQERREKWDRWREQRE